MAVQHLVETHARDCIIVMGEMLAALERHKVLFTVECIKLLEVRKAFRRHLLCPIVGGVHALGFGGEEGGDLDVAGVHAKQRSVLAGTAALHRGADHHDGVGKRETRVGGRQEHRLRTATAGARDGEAGGVDFGKGEEEVDAAD